MTRTLTRVALAAMALSPAFAFAAYNDVSITSSATLSVGGIEVAMSGSSAVLQSVTVGASSFSIVMLPGSIFSVSAPNLNILSVDISGASAGIVSTCTGSASTLALLAPPTGQSTIVVNVSSSLCTSGTSSGSSGGGGGTVVGLITGNGSPASILPVASSTNTSLPTASIAPDSAKKLAILTANLKRSTKNAQVKVLQQMLNKDSATLITTVGSGSPGQETAFFGALTEQAVKKFQAKHNIVSFGSPATTGYGAVGPKTRAKLNELYAK